MMTAGAVITCTSEEFSAGVIVQRRSFAMGKATVVPISGNTRRASTAPMTFLPEEEEAMKYQTGVRFQGVFASVLVIACISLGLAGTLLAQSGIPVPNPTVIGAIPATVVPGDPSHDYPFFSTNVDLAIRGYTEEEYFFEGTANTYNVNPAVSKLDTAVITGSGYPYRTRMIVRRPLSAEDFNGTVIMEWQNVTAGYEPDALWIASHDHLMRRGYAWIGVSVQKNGVHMAVTGLRAWSPIRYGSLADPARRLDLTDSGTVTNDGLCWDVFSQAAQAVRHPLGVDPMGGLNVERIFAVGWSQSAIRLSSYHNSIHPLANVFDAFGLIGVDGQVLLPLRTDLNVKVFKVQPETDVAGNGIGISQALLRPFEPNTGHFRRWEVSGAAHLGYHEAQEAAPLQARDLPPSPPLACDSPPLSRIPGHFVMNAAYDYMVEWVKHNVAPPIGPDIEIAGWNGNFAILARDSGNALGGIRLSQHAVPTATNTGLNTPVATSCRYVGSYQPFDQATLDALYPRHGTYVSQVARVTNENKRVGFIVPEDAEATIREAAHSDIGRQ
jgi:Alpha/beta hydrolase domain